MENCILLEDVNNKGQYILFNTQTKTSTPLREVSAPTVASNPTVASAPMSIPVPVPVLSANSTSGKPPVYVAPIGRSSSRSSSPRTSLPTTISLPVVENKSPGRSRKLEASCWRSNIEPSSRSVVGARSLSNPIDSSSRDYSAHESRTVSATSVAANAIGLLSREIKSDPSSPMAISTPMYKLSGGSSPRDTSSSEDSSDEELRFNNAPNQIVESIDALVSTDVDKKVCQFKCNCRFGLTCLLAHTQDEIRIFTLREILGQRSIKSSICKHYDSKKGCSRSDEECRFAHGEKDQVCETCGAYGHGRLSCIVGEERLRLAMERKEKIQRYIQDQ